jgi:hypothetical protein
MQYGIFSERLKYSIIKPIHIKGDKSLLSNYRPISLLTFFSKVVKVVLICFWDFQKFESRHKKHRFHILTTLAVKDENCFYF